jgi:hypothetical protein
LKKEEEKEYVRKTERGENLAETEHSVFFGLYMLGLRPGISIF